MNTTQANHDLMNFRRTRRGVAIYVILFLLTLAAQPADAATRIWTGAHATSSDWSRNNNWDTVAPVDGDTVVFPAGAARLSNNNDIAGLQLVAIRFIGAGGGYTLGGNQIRLSDRIVSENTAGANTVNLTRITLDSGARFVVQESGVSLVIASDVALNGNDLAANPSGTLVLRGVISGNGSLNKNGDGILTLSGTAANTFTGDVFVNAGSLFMGKSSGLAVPHRLVIGDGVGGAQSDIAANVASDQVNEVTVNASGLWNLGNFTENIADLVLNEGGDVQTGNSGNLRLEIGTDVTVTPSTAPVQDTSFIAGNLELLLGTHTFTVPEGQVAPIDRVELQIDAVVSGLGGITKEGAGDLLLAGNNTFGARATVNGGDLRLSHSSALGTTLTGTVVNNDAALLLLGNVDVGDEALTLNSTGRTGAFNASAPLRALGANSWDGDITLQQETRISVATNGQLTLNSTISGVGGIVKEEPGTLRLAGNAANNTYSGTTFVNAGTLELDKGTIGGVVAVPGLLVIGDGVGGTHADVVRHRKDNQVNRVTVNGSGFWDLGVFEDEVSELTLNGGGDVTTDTTGLLRLGINADVTVIPGTTAGTEVSTISGNLELLLGTHRFSVDNGTLVLNDARLTIDAAVSGLGAIVKEGLDIIELTGANTFAGRVTVTAGSLYANNDLALGLTTSGTEVNNTGVLYLQADVADESLTLDTAGLTPTIPAALVVAGDQSWSGPVTLLRRSLIDVSGALSSLDLGGVISGVGGITTIGPGTLILSGNNPNTFTGDLLVNEGTLELNKGALGGVLAVPGRLIIGDGVGGTHADVARHLKNNQVNTVTVNGSGLWDLGTHEDEVSDLDLIDGGDVTTAATGLLRLGINADVTVTPGTAADTDVSSISGNLELLLGTHRFTVDNGNSTHGDGDLIVNAVVSGVGGITKAGRDKMELRAANSFAASVTIDAGQLIVSDPLALGLTISGTRVNDSGMLSLFGSGTVTGEALTLDTDGLNPPIMANALVISGDWVWTGDVTLLRDSQLNLLSAASLNFSGVISGAGGMTKNGGGTLLLSGNGANTYSGVTTVNEGKLQLNKTGVNVAVPGRLIIGDDAGGANADVVECLSVNEVGENTTVTVNGSGQLIARQESIGALAGSGNITVSSSLNVGNVGTTTVFHGVISGAGAFNKVGTGTLTFNGDNTYTGGTGIADGTLFINGQQPASAVLIQPAGTLGGSGRVGNLSTFAGGATVSPGASPGRLSSGDVNFGAGTHFQLELDGPVPATQHDQLRVFGTVNLGGARLQPTLNFIPTLGQPIVIIDNDGTDSVVDQFNGLSEGDTIRLNQVPFVISYEGGDGNDVTLTATNTSISFVSARVEAGNGNGVIDPNECNHLFLALMNETGGPVAVSRVVLDSATPGVVVTQQRSGYANFGALDIRTNVVPFQIRTAPDFECGSLVELLLTITVTGGGGGTFTIPVTVPSGGAGTPVIFNNGVNAALIDQGQLVSTLNVTGAASLVGKIAVSLHITHPSPGDLVLRLQSPSGTIVPLAVNLGGTTDNYGGGCGNQADRTTFDDDAPVRIAAGTAPFIGSFTPESPLAAFQGEDPNGDWKLLIADTVAGDTGELRCWSLLVSPPDCADGGGQCETCVPNFSGRFDADMPSTLTRLVRNGIPSGCGSVKVCPSVITGPRLFYRVHLITNAGPATCVSVVLNDLCRASNLRLHAAAYLDSYDPADPCANYLGDTGSELTSGSTSFSFAAPENAVIAIVVSSPVTSTTCPISYGLQLHGLPCPPPTLFIEKTANPDEVRLFWSTAYPDFDLQRTPNLNGTPPYPFVNVPFTPFVVNGEYSVTNRMIAPQSYWRLRKP